MSLCRFQWHSKEDFLLSKIWKLILPFSVTLFCEEMPQKYQTELIELQCNHGRNLVGDTRDVSPHFFRRGDIICHAPPTFFSWGLYLERFQN